MKVELQCGDTITIPEGCKAIVKDGSVVFEKEEVQEFKRGDVIVSKIDEILLVTTYDFDSNLLTSFVNIDAHGNLFNNPYQKWNVYHDWRIATDEEKQLLFDKMKEQGLKWNAEEKRVETIRWRAKKGYIYHRLTCYLRSTNECDDYQTWNQKCHDSYNYFHTEQQTKEAARRVKETLRKYHEEIAE